MNKIIQYIHRPNNTELGKGNTHECYMLISSSYNLEEIFPNNVEQPFTHIDSGKNYTLKAVVGNEYRVNQMGEFYRDLDVSYGDVIICTKIIEGDLDKQYISVQKGNYIVFSGSELKGFEIFNKERLRNLSRDNPLAFNVSYYGEEIDISISFYKSAKKRKDSPNFTDYYKIQSQSQNLKGIYILDLDSNQLFDFQKSEVNIIKFKFRKLI